jgi:N-acetylneuraminate synthase
MGGFSSEGHLPPDNRKKLYQRIKDAFSRLDLSTVEIIPQTMPPFPWHFGGQSYHNLFVGPFEIQSFCEQTTSRICLDISHTKLACSYYGWSLKDFLEVVGPFVAHIHIVDAKGCDQEGLQIGEGEIDFEYLGELLTKYCPGASFIPEIWQGHKNKGEGFWKALTKLEGLL